jgi:DNA-binding PadR family transcriptional regulator
MKWRVRSLEERVLRVLYEGSASASDCASELQRYDGAPEGLVGQVQRLLADLAERSCVEMRIAGSSARYRITPAGSERLATLAELSQ